MSELSFKNPSVPSKKLWWEHLKSRWWIYGIGIAGVVGTNIIDVMLPKFIQWIIDHFLAEGTFLVSAFWGLLALYLAQAVARFVWRKFMARETHLCEAKLKSSLWDKARFLPSNRLDTDLSPGELMNIATADVNTGRFLFGFTMVGTADFIFLFIFTVGAMLWIDVKLTLLALIVIPFVPFALDKLARKEHRLHREAQERLSELTDQASQSVATVKLQKISQSFPFWLGLLSRAAKRYQKKRYEAVVTDLAFFPITGVAPLISYGILITVGGRQVLSGDLSIGAFVAMQSYIFIIQTPLIELGFLVSEWQRSFASLNRVTRIFREEESPMLRDGGEAFTTKKELFSLNNLGFKHSDSDKALFKDFNLEIRQGERLGITGPVGSGKSTLINMLAGFEQGYTGKLLLSGKEYTHYSHVSIRQKISLVPQKTFLFADTLRANISLDRELSDEELWFYLELAGLSEDVQRFPQKLDTSLGEWGVNLSGGQKQRLTLARAFARRPATLLLDDCLSAVDTVTEEKILQNIDRYYKDCTIVWVAHRSSSLKYCDRLLELTL